jgi:AraC-like DNA-binding protein
MAEPRTDPPRGLLNLGEAADRIALARYIPTAPVGEFVEHYWTVRWDLRGLPPFTSENLPYPSVHLVLQDGSVHVQGVPTGKFQRTLQDLGMVFGVKFKPGGFRPFIGSPVAFLTDRTVPASNVLDWSGELRLTSAADASDAELVADVELVLRAHLPAADPLVADVNQVVEAIATDRTLVRVEQLVKRFGTRTRQLQRLFREYVGVTPKWVIQRYRLFEASARLAAGEADSAALAHELGYFDQAHFIRDFKALVGQPPGAFGSR